MKKINVRRARSTIQFLRREATALTTALRFASAELARTRARAWAYECACEMLGVDSDLIGYARRLEESKNQVIGALQTDVVMQAETIQGLRNQHGEAAAHIIHLEARVARLTAERNGMAYELERRDMAAAKLKTVIEDVRGALKADVASLVEQAVRTGKAEGYNEGWCEGWDARKRVYG